MGQFSVTIYRATGSVLSDNQQTGGTWTVTGPADGSAMATPALDTTNRAATGDEVTITLDGGSFDAGENINYQINGGAVVSVDVAGDAFADAVTALTNSLNSQLGLTATADINDVITVTGPAGAANDLTITASVETNATDNNGDTEAAGTPAVPEVVTLTPDSTFDAGTMSVQIGGSSYQVAWDTDLPTTLANFVTLNKAAIETQLGSTATLTVNGTNNALLLTGAADGSDITLNGTAVVNADFTVSHVGDPTLAGDSTGLVTTGGAAEVTVTDNSVTITDAANEAANAGTDNQTLTVTTTAGTPEQTVGGQAADTLTGGAGDDTFHFVANDSVEGAMDVITDFQAGDGSVDTDTLNLTSTTVRADVVLANQIDVATSAVGATAGTDIGAIVEDGMIKLVGADAAEIDTLAEWIDVAEQVLAPAEVGAFEFDSSTYVVEEGANIVELQGTVGIVGVSTTEDSNVLHIA